VRSARQPPLLPAPGRTSASARPRRGAAAAPAAKRTGGGREQHGFKSRSYNPNPQLDQEPCGRAARSASALLPAGFTPVPAPEELGLAPAPAPALAPGWVRPGQPTDRDFASCCGSGDGAARARSCRSKGSRAASR